MMKHINRDTFWGHKTDAGHHRPFGINWLTLLGQGIPLIDEPNSRMCTDVCIFTDKSSRLMTWRRRRRRKKNIQRSEWSWKWDDWVVFGLIMGVGKGELKESFKWDLLLDNILIKIFGLLIIEECISFENFTFREIQDWTLEIKRQRFSLLHFSCVQSSARDDFIERLLIRYSSNR